MAMPLVPSYNTQRVYGTWVKQGGAEMRAGSYKVTVPVRVTNATDDVIIPLGVFDTGTLNTTPGVPSLDILVPCTDDTDNLPRGWQLHIEVTFNDAPGEKYVLDVPVAGPAINLRTVVLSETLPVPKDVLIVGVPGGIAALDVDGDVVDAAGDKVTGGGVTEVTAASIQDATATGRNVLTAASQASARTAIGAGTSNLALGTTASTAKAGNWMPSAADVGAVPTARTVAGKALSSDVTLTAADVAAVPTTRTVAGKPLSSNVTLAKGDVGLSNVDNTADAAKPVSTAQQAALDGKVPTSRTIAGKPLTADVTLTAGDVGAVPTTRTVAGKALSSNVTLAKGDVGLGNVDNTSDAAKPVSTAQATALAGKAGTSDPTLHFLGYGPTPPDPSGLPDGRVWFLTPGP